MELLKVLRCSKCKKDITIDPPYSIIRSKGKYKDVIRLKGLCNNCNTYQSKIVGSGYLKSDEINEQLKKLENYPYGNYDLDNDGNINTKDGGILPFIPLIIAGIAAASGIAGTTAAAIQNKQRNDILEKSEELKLQEERKKNELLLEEEKRKNDELLKKIKSENDTKAIDVILGEGIMKKEIGELVKNIIKEEMEKSLKLIKKPEFKNYIEDNFKKLSISGKGMIEDPLTEEEQIQEAFDFLEGKGFIFC